MFEAFNILFTPPYSPWFNPIEEFFALFKSNFRSLFLKYQNDERILSRIKQACRTRPLFLPKVVRRALRQALLALGAKAEETERYGGKHRKRTPIRLEGRLRDPFQGLHNLLELRQMRSELDKLVDG